MIGDWEAHSLPYANHALVIDTNLLLLLIVGATDPVAISKFARTDEFNRGDFDTVVRIAEFFTVRKGLLTTPHVLAEVSNFLRRGARFRSTLAAFVMTRTEEHCEPAKHLVQDRLFPAIGLTDVGLLAMACRQHCVLTTDGGLAAAIYSGGGAVINYNHIRFEKI